MKCILCGNNLWNNTLGKLTKCQFCDLIRAKDKYFKIKPQEVYTIKNYFENKDYANYELEKSALEKNFEDRLKRIRKLKKSGRLLEIGSAYGYFLKEARKHYSCSGIELDPQIAKIAKQNSGVQVTSGDFLKIKLRDNYYDVICMFDVIEHLKSPDAFVQKINKVLKPGGVVIIETGDIGAWSARILGKKWRLITPPFHLFYFSKKTLSLLLEKNNYEKVDIDTVGFYRSFAQTIYRLLGINPFSFLYKLNFYINTWDLIFVTAKKSSR